ncbi:MAG: hypothetical protein GF355_08775, partial [Candidatus Eisenbacteria bacterium]|nr:hypothetical protein [Candidatus Eisenbacteria bacterium]
MRTTAVVVLAFIGLAPGAACGQASDLGFRLDTSVIPYPGPNQDPCDDAFEAKWDDGSFENGYKWSYYGCQPPDYGAWGECYDGSYVCEIVFGFTMSGYWPGSPIDVYVWDDASGLPGNALCVLTGLVLPPPAFWPDVSMQPVAVNCCAGGSHFDGFWGDWPGASDDRFIAADENGLGLGCPVTKIAPGIGYPTGWAPVQIVPEFANCQDLAIREWYLDECPGEPTPV